MFGVNKHFTPHAYLQADVTRNDKTIRRLDIPVSENIYGGMTKAEILEAYDKELQLAQQDRTVEQTKEKKNMLESYVYDMRSKVHVQYLNKNPRYDWIVCLKIFVLFDCTICLLI